MRELQVIALVTVATGIAAWWLMRHDDPARTPTSAAVAATPILAQSTAPPTSASTPAAACSSPSAPVVQAAKGGGTVHFTDVGGTHEDLDLQINGGVGLWNAAEHRLRVLLTEEPLSPAEEQQMLGYLRDERLADSGRSYGVLELQFNADASTPRRSALNSATLTVAAAGGVAHDTANVLSSIKWTDDVQSSFNTDGKTRPRLEFRTAGSAHSADATSPQQNWQLSVAVPVVQASAPTPQNSP